MSGPTIRPAPRRFRSIRGKLARLVITSVGVALCLGLILNVWLELGRYRDNRQEALLAAASAMAATAAPSVAKEDAAEVARTLRGIGRIPHFVWAAVTLPDGKLLADAGMTERLDADLDLDRRRQGSLFELLRSRTVGIRVPVVRAGETVGNLVIVRSTADLPDELLKSLAVIAIYGAISLAIGLLLSFQLQRRITAPLSELASVMNRVTETGIYRSQRIITDDEIGQLAANFDVMMRQVQQATDEILARENEIIERLARAGEQRDDQTGQHVDRVAQVSRLIAEGMRLDPEFVADLVKASPLHDVGKISVPDHILFKPGKLDPDERREMELHAQRGHDVLAGSKSSLVRLAAEIALTHHERWDGQGYPRQLSGSAIPLSGRITAVADVCDALLSERPYKKPWPLSEVRAHLESNAGRHFDAACVDALLARWGALEKIYGTAQVA